MLTMTKVIHDQPDGYTRTARLLHWVTAGLVLYQIQVGILVANFELGALYDVHTSVGTLILFQ
jgi:cytochrome b561